MLVLLQFQLGRFWRCCGDGGRIFWSSLASGCSVDEFLAHRMCGRGRRRSAKCRLDDVVKVCGESVLAWVDIDWGWKSANIKGFLYALLDSLLFIGKNGDVLFSEVVIVCASLFKHGGFVMSLGVGRGGCVFLETRWNCPFCFAHIGTCAGGVIGVSAGEEVDKTQKLFVG